MRGLRKGLASVTGIHGVFRRSSSNNEDDEYEKLHGKNGVKTKQASIGSFSDTKGGSIRHRHGSAEGLKIKAANLKPVYLEASIVLDIIEAINLHPLNLKRKSASTYARIIGPDEEEMGKTMTIDQNLFPKWNADFAFDIMGEDIEQIRIEIMDASSKRHECIGVVFIPITNLAPSIMEEHWMNVQASEKFPLASGMCLIRIRMDPVLGAKARGGGRADRRRQSMFPSTAIKEGELYVKAKGSDGPWKQRHFVLTKEQLNYYEDATSMKKLDQVHLLTPLKPGVVGEDGKSVMLARTWDYEEAHRENPDDKTMTVLETFRPWEEKSQAKAEQKRMQTTVLSEKERKHSLIMFRKICQASGVLPTLRIDLYAGDKLKSVCNPYVVFEVKGSDMHDEPTMSGYQINTDAPQWNESFALTDLTLSDDAVIHAKVFARESGDGQFGEVQEQDQCIGVMVLPLVEISRVTLTANGDLTQMQIANTDEKEGAWYNIYEPKHQLSGGADADSDCSEEEDSFGGPPAAIGRRGTSELGDPEGGGSSVTGRIRLRLRLVRPESELELAKKEEASQLAAANQTDLTSITLSLEDELEGYFGVRCSFSNRDLLIWVGSGSNRRQWMKEINRVITQSEEAYSTKQQAIELMMRQNSIEVAKSDVARSAAEVQAHAEAVKARQAELEMQFEIKEVVNDMVSRIEERAAAEAPKLAAGEIDEAKVQEMMRQMAEVERQREELEEQRRKHEEEMKQREQNLANGGGAGGVQYAAPAVAGGDSGYVDWLKKQMMRSTAGMDEDQLNWQFAVDNKQVGNSFLHAEEEEKKAQQKYGAIIAESDLYNRLIGLLKNNPAVDCLKAVSVAKDDVAAAPKAAPVAATAAAAGPVATGPIKLKDDPQFAKYFKMLKMHLPPPAVKQKMAAEGLDPNILDQDPESLSPNSPKAAEPIKLKDDPQFAKYFKMLKMHLPPPAVKQKMAAEGLDPNILDQDPESLSPNSPKAAEPIKLKDDPQFAKYFKMLKMHLPPPAVKQKMAAEGLDPSILDQDPEGPSPNQPAAGGGGGGAAQLLLKDDPQFAKYFKMLKMHLPPPAVKQKMAAEGLDPSILDQDPESPSPNQPAAGAAAAPAAKAAPAPELDMFEQIRLAKELKAKKLAEGGGGGKGGSMKTALKKAEKCLNGPRGAKEELSKLTYPAGDVRFEVLVKSLETVLEMQDNGKSNDAIRKYAKEQAESILASEKDYKEKVAELSKKGDVIDKEIEKWSRRKENAPEKEAMEKELEIKWAKENAEKNEKCLKLMRSYIPSDIKELVAETFAKKVEGTGKFYPRNTSERLRSMKMLHWLVTHPDDIKNANFLKGGTRVAFLNLGEYDMVELRAVFACVPDSFDLDSDGEKKRWREVLVKTIKEQSKKEEDGLLTEKEARNPAYFFATPESMEAQRRVFKDRVDRLALAKAELTKLTADAEDSKKEFDEAMEKFRDKDAQKEFGKDKLRDIKDALKVVYEQKKKLLRAQQGKVDTSIRVCEKDKVERAEMEHEARKIKLYNSWGKPVTPAFTANPVLKKIERLKKMTDAEEAAARKAEMAASLAAKAGGGEVVVESGAGGAGGAAGGAEEGGGKKKSDRVRSEAEIFDSHMDFKVKKSGAMEIKELPFLLLDLGFSRGGDDKKEAKALDGEGEPVTKLAATLVGRDGKLIEKKKVLEWWTITAKPLIDALQNAAMGDDEKEMKTAMGNASDETAPPLIKLHPFFDACKEALVTKTGSDNIIMNKASDDDDFKNKLGAIFGGKTAPPPKEKEKPVVSANMSSKNEDAKNNLAAMFGGKGGGKGGAPPGAPAASPGGRGGKGGRGGVSRKSADETSNPLADDGNNAEPTSPTSPTSGSPGGKPLSKAQQMKKDLEAKEKASGGAGRGLTPLNRPMSETRMVVGYRNLGGVIKLTHDDERLDKFKKMIKMHLPKEAVKQKMTAEGLDPSILDMLNEEGEYDESLKPAGRGRGRLSASGDSGGADAGRGRGRGRGRGVGGASGGPGAADGDKKEFLRKSSSKNIEGGAIDTKNVSSKYADTGSSNAPKATQVQVKRAFGRVVVDK